MSKWGFLFKFGTMSIKELYEVFQKHPKISTDSRQIEEDCLYFALKGEKFNGNEFASEL